MSLALLPTSELVIPAWVNSIPGLDVPCAERLPSHDNTSWGTSGFITTRVISGPSHTYLPQDEPLMQFDVYAVKPATGKPPLWKVRVIAQHLVAATYDEANMRRTLSLSARGKSYGTARVLECYPRGHIRDHDSDAGQYAHVSVDIKFHWVAL